MLGHFPGVTQQNPSVWEEHPLPFAELLERRTNDAPALHDTVSAHPDISQVASDDAVIHDDSLRIPERNIHLKRHRPSLVATVRSFLGAFCLIPYFAIQDDVLTPAENWLSAHFVARRLKLKGKRK